MKKIGIILRLILSFSIISIISIFFIFLLYNIYTRGEGKVYDLPVYILISLLIYKNFIPFIIALSVYSAFFKGYYLPGLQISRIIAIPIALIVVLTTFFGFYDYFLIDKLVYALKEYNTNKDYRYFNQYKSSLKENEYQMAKYEFDNGNLNEAEKLARNALIYDRNDGNILLLLKDIENKKNELEELANTDRATYVNNLLSQGSRAFSLSNYTLANRYYNDVLKIDRHNPIAIYYLNKIGIIQNNKPAYIGNNFYDSLTYGKLADTIELYRNGDFWKAYSSISNLFVNYPDINEISTYYSLIVDSIDRYDFFIDRAQEIRKFFIEDYYSITNTTMLENNGITLMLNNNTMLCALYSIFLRESLYLYDVSIINLDNELKATNKVIYKYGKITDSYNAPNMKNIILKAKFNPVNNTYNNNNITENIIPINMSDSAMKNIKYYTYIVLSYTGFKDIMSLKTELPLFGYSNDLVINVLFKKILSPIYYLLLFIIIAYFSFRYNIYVKKDASIGFTANLIGIIGTILFVLLYIIVLNYINTHILMVLGINISIIIMLSFAVIMILLFLLQMSRINKYVK
ncbi:M48 family metallopeptidase [Brachyspira sp. SAP_772]|uniref:tetratricopeptide repeat protein n=1 Tax=Brachyspira sp. SAP_772 TaxID=2608385 RepID=UPI0012F4BA50|nr:hypothetical protein [Brachyspira sp. SAP_772]